ncbi:MAG: hypothetical protein Q8M15_14060 [Bacteroidota bacterium]|nr:hypothetical protein [Bacteroidota bacterium]
MANHIRIKSSKNLRFKLISLLYLLFISLSIIQIPIEWLRINGPISAYLMKPQIQKIKYPQIQKIHNLVIHLNNEFNKLTTDAVSGKFIEPNEYSKTDRFFITEGNAVPLHHELKLLFDFFTTKQSNPVKKSEFIRLFKDDISNGLTNTDATKWAEWKFKHAPSAVVKTLLADLLLRLNLLNGAIEVSNKPEHDEPMLKMAFNTESSRVGDSIKFLIQDKTDLNVLINDMGKPFPINSWRGDTLIFVPAHAGTFDLILDRNGDVERFQIHVQAKEFAFDAENGFQTFYQGKKSQIEYSNLPDIGSASCSCDKKLVLKKSSKSLEFTPNSSGWCRFVLRSSNLELLLFDSVYIQPVPIPFIFIEGSSENKLSYNRLIQTKKISFAARHPEMPDFIYSVESIQIRLIGVGNKTITINGPDIFLTEEQVKKLRYIIIESVKVKTSNKYFDLDNQMVFQINN